jgi:hypothetical protein
MTERIGRIMIFESIERDIDQAMNIEWGKQYSFVYSLFFSNFG